MPETRYIEEYDNQGNIINRIPYEVSDEELYFEQLQKDANDASHSIKDAHDNWDSLSSSQKREVVKHALNCIICLMKDRWPNVL